MLLPIQPRNRALRAAVAIRALLRDPNDTAQVFHLLDAVSGRSPRHLRERFEQSRAGQRLLAERPRLLDALRDREALAAMPDGSLGRAYLAFMNEGALTPDGLVQASEAIESDDGDEVASWIGDRLRDSHDLWHVVTGYRGDLLGESSLLAFTWAQTRTHALGLIAAVAYRKVEDPDGRRLIADGLVRGLRSAWLPAAPWEELLAQDLDTVRARLRVGPPPVYEPFFASELPPGGVLGRAA